MEYKVYFFREKNSTVDLKKIVDFFESISEITTSFTDDVAKFEYNDCVIENSVAFYITKTLLVPNIYKLNPRYISLNFHLDMEPLLPNYSASIVFNIIEILCRTFNLFIYNSMFENVLPFKNQLLESSYQATKKYTYEQAQNPKLYHMEEEKMVEVLTYQRENSSLQAYYHDLDVQVPRYVFLADEDNIVRLAIEWKEGHKVIFPSNLDLILYRNDSEVKLLYKSQVMEFIDKYLVDVPGFIQGTKIISDDKANKKIKKIMSKTKFNRVNDNFMRINLHSIIDL